jgi:hypothetical protein
MFFVFEFLVAMLFRRSRFAKTGLDFDIPELRGHGIKPAQFDE